MAGGIALGLYLIVRRRHHGRLTLAAGAVATVVALLIGFGVIPLPDFAKLIEDAGQALGKWTYLAVGLLAFLETGAFIGLVAPGETAVIVAGLVAGQGQISLTLLIAIVWACAVAGDVTSFMLGKRLGRGFLVKHGARVKITEERLEQVERFFERRGGITILVGRFIGFVRPIAPFIAGASHMPTRKFLPYDVLGAGLWAATFSVLGFVFWRSFDRLTQWVSRGLFALGLLAAVVGGIAFLVRLQRNPELRRRTGAWFAAQLDRRWLRPFAPGLRAAWYRVVRPVAARAEAPAKFVWNRFTPGELGLEVTTLLALAAVGLFTFILLGDLLDEQELLPFDDMAFRVADALYVQPVADVAEWVSALGSLPAVGAVALVCAARAVVARRGLEAAVLPAGLFLTWLWVDIARHGFDREPPPRPHVDPGTMVFPDDRAAYAVAYIACALVLVRAGNRLAVRFAAVTAAVVLVVVVALAPVYLRVHFFSDVEAGLGAGATVFCLLGVLVLVVGRLRHNEATRA
jgi:undecaprenyl-diphosphatase